MVYLFWLVDGYNFCCKWRLIFGLLVFKSLVNVCNFRRGSYCLGVDILGFDGGSLLTGRSRRLCVRGLFILFFTVYVFYKS